MTKERYNSICDRWLALHQIPLLGIAFCIHMGLPVTLYNWMLSLAVLIIGGGLLFTVVGLVLYFLTTAILFGIYLSHNAYRWCLGLRMESWSTWMDDLDLGRG